MKNFCKVLLSILAISMATASYAEFELEEIVVTAQKRAENLQDTPAAITALTEEETKLLGIGTTVDLALTTPNMVVSNLVGNFQPYIRGVGNNLTQGVSNSVATYIDGIYVKSIWSANQNLHALERIEILRGPQGTLYGRNATGGAMNIITKDPYEDSEGNVEVGYGNFDELKASLFYNTPLSDSVAALVTVNYSTRESYLDNKAPGQPDIDDVEDLQINAKIGFDVTDSLSAVFNVMYLDRDRDEVMVRQQTQADGSSIQFGALVGLNTLTTEPHDVFTDNDNRHEIEHTLVGLTLDWELESFDVKSITSYQNVASVTWTDFDGAANPLFAFNFNVTSDFDTYTQEIQVTSKPDSKVDWIAGLYYLYDDGGFDPLTLGFGAGGSQDGVENNTTEAFAAFVQMTYPLTDALSVTAGLRYSYEEKVQESMSAVFNHPVFGTLPLPALTLPAELAVDWDELTPKISFEYRLNNATLAWVSYTKGFKSGGWNPGKFPQFESDVVDPEKIDSWEIGIKSDLFDDRLRLNATAFLYDYKNQQYQLTEPSTGAAVVRNAASSEIKGIELEGTAILSDNFSVNFAAAYLDGEYDDFPNAESVLLSAGDPLNPIFQGAINIPTQVDATGNAAIRSPEFNFNISPRYVIPLDYGELLVSGILSWTDAFEFSGDGLSSQGSYAILNASIQYTSSDEKWYVRAWGKNIADEEYLAYHNVNALGTLFSWADPRTFGLTAGYNF